MKKLLILVAMLAVAAPALAVVTSHVGDGNTTSTSVVERESFYCQAPTANAGNASSAFFAEIADDMPDAHVGTLFNTVGGWCLMWGAGWQDPVGVTINIYTAECPPDLAPAYSYYFLWGELDTTYDPQGGYDTYYFEALLPGVLTVETAMSVGFQFDNNWGQNPPYVGACFSTPVTGCGTCWWDGTYWGYPRWTNGGSYFGDYDMAYCLGYFGTAAEESSWSSVRSLY